MVYFKGLRQAWQVTTKVIIVFIKGEEVCLT